MEKRIGRRKREREKERKNERQKERKKYEVGEDSNIRRKRNKER